VFSSWGLGGEGVALGVVRGGNPAVLEAETQTHEESRQSPPH